MKSYRKEVEARYKKKQERRKSRKISRRFLVDDSSSSDSSDDDNITNRSSVVPIIPSGPSRVGTLPSVHPFPRVFRRGSLRRSLRRGSVPHMPRPGSFNRRSRLSSAKAPLSIKVSYDEFPESSEPLNPPELENVLITTIIQPLNVEVDVKNVTLTTIIQPLNVKVDVKDVTLTTNIQPLAVEVEAEKITLTTIIQPLLKKEEKPLKNIQPVKREVESEDITLTTTIQPLNIKVDAKDITLTTTIQSLSVEVDAEPTTLTTNIQSLSVKVDAEEVIVITNIQSLSNDVDAEEVIDVPSLNEPIEITTNIQSLTVEVEPDEVTLTTNIQPLILIVESDDIILTTNIQSLSVEVKPDDIILTTNTQSLDVEEEVRNVISKPAKITFSKTSGLFLIISAVLIYLAWLSNQDYTNQIKPIEEVSTLTNNEVRNSYTSVNVIKERLNNNFDSTKHWLTNKITNLLQYELTSGLLKYNPTEIEEVVGGTIKLVGNHLNYSKPLYVNATEADHLNNSMEYIGRKVTGRTELIQGELAGSYTNEINTLRSLLTPILAKQVTQVSEEESLDDFFDAPESPESESGTLKNEAYEIIKSSPLVKEDMKLNSGMNQDAINTILMTSLTNNTKVETDDNGLQVKVSEWNDKLDNYHKIYNRYKNISEADLDKIEDYSREINELLLEAGVTKYPNDELDLYNIIITPFNKSKVDGGKRKRDLEDDLELLAENQANKVMIGDLNTRVLRLRRNENKCFNSNIGLLIGFLTVTGALALAAYYTDLFGILPQEIPAFPIPNSTSPFSFSTLPVSLQTSPFTFPTKPFTTLPTSPVTLLTSPFSLPTSLPTCRKEIEDAATAYTEWVGQNISKLSQVIRNTVSTKDKKSLLLDLNYYYNAKRELGSLVNNVFSNVSDLFRKLPDLQEKCFFPPSSYCKLEDGGGGRRHKSNIHRRISKKKRSRRSRVHSVKKPNRSRDGRKSKRVSKRSSHRRGKRSKKVRPGIDGNDLLMVNTPVIPYNTCKVWK